MAQTRRMAKAKSSFSAENRGQEGLIAATNGQSRAGDKYQRILDAAIAVIAEKGFHNSRVSEIAERADVASGTVYLYFKSKEQILMAALDAAFESFFRRAQNEIAASSDAAEQLRILACLHLQALGGNRNIAIMLQTELRQSAKFLAQFSQQEMKAYFNLIREIIREGQRAGSIRPEVSDKIAASCFFGALDELVTAWVLSTREYDLAEAADEVVNLLLVGMTAAKKTGRETDPERLSDLE
jgi:TetR/AcrR family transcriptional regulator, fatty acid metabolism regulator protein